MFSWNARGTQEEKFHMDISILKSYAIKLRGFNFYFYPFINSTFDLDVTVLTMPVVGKTRVVNVQLECRSDSGREICQVNAHHMMKLDILGNW